MDIEVLHTKTKKISRIVRCGEVFGKWRFAIARSDCSRDSYHGGIGRRGT